MVLVIEVDGFQIHFENSRGIDRLEKGPGKGRRKDDS